MILAQVYQSNDNYIEMFDRIRSPSNCVGMPSLKKKATFCFALVSLYQLVDIHHTRDLGHPKKVDDQVMVTKSKVKGQTTLGLVLSNQFPSSEEPNVGQTSNCLLVCLVP